MATIKRFASPLETIAGATDFHDETNTVPNTEVRLGAIYALEKLARDDLEIHWPIMETLCAYVRKNAGPPKSLDEIAVALLDRGIHDDDAREQLNLYRRSVEQPAVDVQAAITVIGRRSDAQRDFERAQREQTKFSSTDAWRLNLARCNLARADLTGLNLDAVILGGSSLAFANCANADLIGARFDDAHLEGARFMGTHLEKAWLFGAHLQGAWLNQAHFESATLRRAHLEGAFLAQANLQAADLTDAHLGSADLSLARMESARFERACFDGASFDRALTSDAFMDGADLSSAREIMQEQIEIMWGDSATKLPMTLRRPTNDFWLDLEVGGEAGDSRDERWFALWRQRLDEIAESRGGKPRSKSNLSAAARIGDSVRVSSRLEAQAMEPRKSSH